MPELVDVASHFDDITVNDAYTGTFAFYGQFSSFDESSPDGSVARKRTMSVRPGTAIPGRKAITFLGETWILGDGNTDGLQDTAIRKAYWMRKSVGLLSVVSPLQLLTSAAGTSMYAARNYLKDTVNGVTDTEYDPFWDISVTTAETTPIGYFVKNGAEVYRVRGTHVEASGFKLVQCDQLDVENLLTVTVNTATAYDPVTDTVTNNSASVSGALIEPSKFYRYRNLSDDKFNSGDLTLLTATSPTVGSNVTFGGASWRVLGVQQELDAWASHIRRV